VAVVSLYRSSHKIRTVVIVGMLAVTIAAVMPQRFWDRMQTIAAPQDERDVSADARLYFWGIARTIAIDHPLFGVGFNSYRYSFPDYNTNPDFEGEQRAVHSVWFGLVAELGVPGLFLFVALLISTVRSCYRIRRDATARGLTGLAIYAGHLQTSVLVFVIGGTFLNAQYLELLWHVVGLTIALEHLHANAIANAADARMPAPVLRTQAFPLPTPRQADAPRTGTSGPRRFFATPADGPESDQDA
jgi:O-antigen ligase